jgi:hypothetical protein
MTPTIIFQDNPSNKEIPLEYKFYKIAFYAFGLVGFVLGMIGCVCFVCQVHNSHTIFPPTQNSTLKIQNCPRASVFHPLSAKRYTLSATYPL